MTATADEHAQGVAEHVHAPSDRHFEADSAAPAEARAYVIATAAAYLNGTLPGRLSDDLQLVVSELVTNAVRAESPSVRVEVGFERNRILLAVEDLGSGWPEPREAGIHDTNGRGLALVSAICASWGVRLSGADRKVVWAELDVPE